MSICTMLLEGSVYFGWHGYKRTCLLRGQSVFDGIYVSVFMGQNFRAFEHFSSWSIFLGIKFNKKFYVYVIIELNKIFTFRLVYDCSTGCFVSIPSMDT